MISALLASAVFMNIFNYIIPKKSLNYELVARMARAQILNMIHRAGTGHAGSNLSCVEILLALYGEILNIDPKNPQNPDRDRFILSKGHAAAALWVTLAGRGFFPKAVLSTYCQDGGLLPGLVTENTVPGVEVSLGSLGTGFPFACGLALAAKKNNASYKIFCLLSDGELDEGSVWEAMLFAPQHHLDNLVAIVDYNKIQSYARIDEIISIEPLAKKARAFGWTVKEIDGHNIKKIISAFRNIPKRKNKPTFIIAHTIKGKGISFLQDSVSSHHTKISASNLAIALQELSIHSDQL